MRSIAGRIPGGRQSQDRLITSLAGVSLRFGNELEGRRLRRPRYRDEPSPLLGIDEDFGELSRAAPGGASASPWSLALVEARRRRRRRRNEDLVVVFWGCGRGQLES